jgi:hypothetical protein
MEGRDVPSAAAYGDFNNDGLVDVATVTSPTTIVVSLANPDGSYIVSATLTAPNNEPVGGITVKDVNGDGNLDVTASGISHDHFYTHVWLGNGDGTFDARDTQKSGHSLKWIV